MQNVGDGQPYYKLSSFQHVIRELPLDTLRIAYSSAIAPIMTVRHCSEDEARDYIRQVVLDLKKGHYAKTIGVGGAMPADEYGVIKDGIPLYVKLIATPKGKLTTENHLILSCHPTRFDLRTLNGVVPQYTGQVLPAITQ